MSWHNEALAEGIASSLRVFAVARRTYVSRMDKEPPSFQVFLAFTLDTIGLEHLAGVGSTYVPPTAEAIPYFPQTVLFREVRARHLEAVAIVGLNETDGLDYVRHFVNTDGLPATLARCRPSSRRSIVNADFPTAAWRSLQAYPSERVPAWLSLPRDH